MHDDEDYTVRIIELHARFSQEVREIHHYCFHGWPDHGAPAETAKIRQFYWLVKVWSLILAILKSSSF